MTEKPKPDDGIYFKDFQDTKQSFLTDQRIIWTVKEPGKAYYSTLMFDSLENSWTQNALS